MFSFPIPLDFVLGRFPICDYIFLHSQDIKLSAESQWQGEFSVDLFFNDLTFPLLTCLLANSSVSLIQPPVYWKTKLESAPLLVVCNFGCRITVWKTKGSICSFFRSSQTQAWNFVGTFCYLEMLLASLQCQILIRSNGSNQLLTLQLLLFLHRDKVQ